MAPSSGIENEVIPRRTEPQGAGLGGEVPTPHFSLQTNATKSGQSPTSNDGLPDVSAEEKWDVDQRSSATEQLIREFHADVYRYCFWLCQCSETAEDATQETFLRAFRGVDSLRDISSAKSWLLRIARNEVFRTQAKKRVPTTSLEGDITSPPPPTTLEDCEWLNSGLQKINPDFRLILLMYYFEHLSYADISEQLELPLGTVMSRLNRGKKQLKLILEQSPPKKPTEDAS